MTLKSSAFSKGKKMALYVYTASIGRENKNNLSIDQ